LNLKPQQVIQSIKRPRL